MMTLSLSLDHEHLYSFIDNFTNVVLKPLDQVEATVDQNALQVLTFVETTLVTLREWLACNSVLATEFTTRHYDTFASLLLTRVYINWFEALNEDAQKSYEYFFSEAFPSTKVFMVIVNGLHANAPESILPHIYNLSLRLLEKFVVQHRITKFINELEKQLDRHGRLLPSAQLCIATLVATPTHIANVIHRNIPSEFLASNWINTLLEQCLVCLPNLVDSRDGSQLALNSTEFPRVVIAALLDKLIRLNFSAQCSYHICDSMIKRTHPATEIPSAIFKPYVAIFYGISVTSCESFWFSLINQLSEFGSSESVDSTSKVAILANTLRPLFVASNSADEPTSNTSTYLPIIRPFVTMKFYVSRPLSQNAKLLLLRALKKVEDSAYESESTNLLCHPFQDLLMNLSQQWASESFYKSASTDEHGSIAIVLHCALTTLRDSSAISNLAQDIANNYSTSEELESEVTQIHPGPHSAHPCIPNIMDGVQFRMSSTVKEIRESGMRVAVAMSYLIDPEHPLKFDLDSEEEENKVDNALKVAASNATKVASDRPKGPSSNVMSSRITETSTSDSLVLSWDPDQPYEGSDNGILSLVDWGSDDVASTSVTDVDASLPHFSIADNQSDLRKVPFPIYPREILEYLRKQEDRHHIEAALEVCEHTIRSRAVGLSNVAIELCGQLLQVGTTVYLEEPKEKLNLWRLNSIGALISLYPYQTLPYLFEQLDSNNHSLSAKMDIMSSLISSAQELAGEHERKKEKYQGTPTELEGSSDVNKNKSLDTSDWRSDWLSKAMVSVNTSKPLTMKEHNAIIAKRVESRTRRWGQRTSETTSGTVNAFAEVAHLYFFPLLKLFPHLSSDTMLCTTAIDALSTFVYLCSNTATFRPVSIPLVELLLATRQSTEITVRRATFLSLFRFLLACSSIMFVTEFIGMVSTLLSWLQISLQNDPDTICRQMCTFCMKALKDLIGETGDLLSMMASPAPSASKSKSMFQIV